MLQSISSYLAVNTLSVTSAALLSAAAGRYLFSKCPNVSLYKSKCHFTYAQRKYGLRLFHSHEYLYISYNECYTDRTTI